MSTPVSGSLATVPLHVAAGDIAVWWNDPGGVWESVPLGSGPAGPQGPAGAVGATGPAGATGVTGAQGIQGVAGPTGPAGATGAASTVPGPTGATGAQGLQGVAGPTGATGATGAAGSANMSGMVAGQIPIAATATSVTSSIAAGHLPATQTNDNAAAGEVGEFIFAITLIASEVTISGITANIAQITLTSGDWDVWGEVWLDNQTGGASVVNGSVIASITPATQGQNNTPASNTANSTYSSAIVGTSIRAIVLPVGPMRFLIAAPTILYLTGSTSTSSGTAHAYGKICARRAR